MEITRFTAVVIHLNALLYMLFHFQITVNDQCTTRLNEFSVVTEAFKIGLFCTVDVKMIRVSRGDNAHPWTQPMKASVKLIGLNDHVIAAV